MHIPHSYFLNYVGEICNFSGLFYSYYLHSSNFNFSYDIPNLDINYCKIIKIKNIQTFFKISKFTDYSANYVNS